MAAKLYVGGLPYSVTDDVLKQSFSQAGTVVSATVIMDKFTNRSKGFGFVEMSSDEEAKAAIAMFDGKDYEGRILKVNEARPMEPRENRSFGGGGGRGSESGGTVASGLARFCGDPFSRMGSKIRAEKFLRAAASKNVLGQSSRPRNKMRKDPRGGLFSFCAEGATVRGTVASGLAVRSDVFV